MRYETGESRTYNSRLKKVVPLGTHYSFRMPWESKQIHFARARGSRVWDLDGNEYLDFFARFGANILGHNDPRYNAALAGVLTGAAAVTLGTAEAEAAEMICEFVPSAERVRFSLSGTEAVQSALRLARAYTGRPRFVRFRTHYHGGADNVLGAGELTDTEGKAEGVEHESVVLPWNEAGALDSVLTASGTQIAAVLMEPICVNGGGVRPAPGYLEEVRRLCDAHGVVLIFDEVITGFRVGLGGAQAELGVTPDLTTLGKAMAGGALPVSAIAGRSDIMRLYETRRVVHGGTFNGFPLGIAAVRATLDILSADGGRCYEVMAERMREIQSAFLTSAAKHGLTFEMRGVDAAGVFHAAPGDPVARHLVKITSEAMAERGVLVSNLNRFYGSLAVDADDIALFEQRIDEVFDVVAPFVDKLRT